MRFFACTALLITLSSIAIAADPDPEKGSITGTVVGTDGVGLADIPVKIFYAKDPNKKIALADAPVRPGLDPIAETKSDKDGKFKLENLAPADYMVIGGDALKGLARSPASVKPGKDVEVKLTIRKRKIG
jgi:hypothetical protein